MVKAWSGDSTLDEVAHLLHKHCEGSLDPVVNTCQQPRAELHRKGKPGIGDRFARPDPGGILVDLDDCVLTLDLDDLPHQFLIADLHHVVHVCVETNSSDDRP